MTKVQRTNIDRQHPYGDFIRHSDFDIRHSHTAFNIPPKPLI
jgi:hypothetical protein